MKIVAISDTHNQLSKIELPEGDLLIHAGDATNQGKVQEVEQFGEDLLKVIDRYTFGVLLVAGNHDQLAEENSGLFRGILSNVLYLQDQGITLDGLNIYGSPWTPRFYDWAFNADRGDVIAEKWKLIPTDTDILVTHGPAFGILDKNANGRSVGCEELRKRIDLYPPRLHIFGHIHGSHGTRQSLSTLFVNAAICNEHYRPTNMPTVINTDELPIRC